MKPSETRISDLRPARAGEPVERALHHVERRAQAGVGLEVHVGRASRDVGVVGGAGPLVRALAGLHRLRHTVRLVTPHHALDHLRVAVDVDPQRLVVRHALGAHVGDQAPVEGLHHVDELLAARLHARGPPGPAGRGDERHAVAFAGALLEEARHGGLRLVGAPGRDVHVVEDHDERARALLLGGDVRGDLGRRRRSRGRLVRQLDRLERDDVLLDAVLGHGHVGRRQALDRHAFLVGDDQVDDHLLELGGKRRRLARGGGDWGLGRGRGGGGLGRLLGEQAGRDGQAQ